MIWALLVACGLFSAEVPTAEDAQERVVSLTPAITETVAELGRVDLLVGRSEWCTQPESVRSLPSVGSGLTPELERIAALRPTRILLDASHASQIGELQALAPVEVLPWLTLDEVVGSVNRLGVLLDASSAAETLAAELGALDVTPPPDGPEVLLTLGGANLEDGELWYVRPGSLHGQVLHAAGARNAIVQEPSGPPVLSLEALVALDPPAIVVLVAMEADDEVAERAREDLSRLAPLRAVASGRVGVVSGPTMMSTGPSIRGTVRSLRQAIDALPPLAEARATEPSP